MLETVKWRGTPGVGDFMMALNVCHNYAFVNKKKIVLEMHWEHDENYLHHPKDPETIIQRMEWIHTKYHRQDDVTITHVYNSDLFESGAFNNRQDKDRFYFDSGAYSGDAPPSDWIFKKEELVPKKKKIVMWTPTYNKEPPRSWKRFLTNDDWYGIIKLLSWEGWILVELNYRTPIKEAYKQIQECDFVVCYDGMWHYISRNFSKPMFIPSWEGITRYHTPQAVKRPNINIKNFPDFTEAQKVGRQEVKDFFKTGGEDFTPSMNEMKSKANRYLKRISEYYED
jgi:hypothetical protein